MIDQVQTYGPVTIEYTDTGRCLITIREGVEETTLAPREWLRRSKFAKGKLDDGQREKIRFLNRDKDWTLDELAARYNVSRRTILRAIAIAENRH